MVCIHPFYNAYTESMWEDVSKTLINLVIGLTSVFMQVFQQIQSIVAFVAGIVTIIYLYYQIRKIRLDIKLKQNQFKENERKNELPGSFTR